MRLNTESKSLSTWVGENGVSVLLPVVAAIIAGLVIGVLAFSGQTLFILLLFGALVALALVARPVPLLYLAVLFTLVIGGMVKYLIPDFAALSWLGYLLAAALYLPAAVAVLTRKEFANAPARPEEIVFVWSAMGFLLVGLLSTLLSNPSGEQVLGAIKTYVMYAGIWAALSWLAFRDDTLRKLAAMLVGIGLVQWVVTIFQYSYAKTYRVDAVRATASDAVVGTFGGSPDSGGLSAVMTLYLVLIACAVIQAYRTNQISRGRMVLCTVFLSIPLLLTEVKAFFIYLPVSLVILYRDKIKERPLQFVLSIPLIVLVVTVGIYIYFSLHWAGENASVDQAVQHNFAYSFSAKEGEDALNPSKLSRRETLEFWWRENSRSTASKLLLGHGLGASKVGGRAPGPVGERYGGLNIDSNGLAILLWDTGVFGLAFAVFMFVAAVLQAMRLALSSALNAWQRVMANALSVAFVLFLISLPYRNDIPYAAPMMLLVMACFGLVSWLKRQEFANTSSLVSAPSSDLARN